THDRRTTTEGVCGSCLNEKFPTLKHRVSRPWFAMPINHKSALRPRRDVYANAEERLVLRHAPSQMSVELEEHKHLRTAAPTHMPLRRTLMWAASLPP